MVPNACVLYPVCQVDMHTYSKVECPFPNSESHHQMQQLVDK